MRKNFVYVLTLAFVFLSCQCAFSAWLFESQDSNNPIDVEFEDGLHVEFLGAYIFDGDGNVHNFFRVTSDKDTTIEVNSSTLFDDRGGRFPLGPLQGRFWGVRMSGYNTVKLDVLADVPVLVLFAHLSGYEPQFRSRNLRTIVRVTHSFNGHELTFSKVQTHTWQKWLEKVNSLGYAPKEWWIR